ncbi:uncharacterized protein LOC115228566 isoform X1 [Octopus sinensis]|uniref:Uncharacterized protein LOC115228566 isoform X1 n=1 Tax=Octopus sinensis TaxID=2607531 RepID=A0A6P7U0C8_9MOLL|nr:uncharacterized protein LOC115228566 isoform X1 [Octopus sinensis]
MKNNSSNLHDSVVIEATSYNKLLSQFEEIVASSDFSPVQDLTSAKTSSISLIPTSFQNITTYKTDGVSHQAPTITVSATRNENSLPRKLSLVSNGIVKKLVKNRHGISVSSLLRDPRVSKMKLVTDVQCNGTNAVNGISNQNQVNVASVTDVENSDPLQSNVLKPVSSKLAGNQTIKPNSETNQTGISAVNDTKDSIPPIVLPELSITRPVKKSASTDEFPDLLKPQNLTRYVELSSLKSQDNNNNNSSKKQTIQYRPYYSHLRDHDYTLNCPRFIPKEKSTTTTTTTSTKRSFIIPKKKKKLSDDQCLNNSVSNNSNKDSDNPNTQEYFSNDPQTNSLNLENENSSSPNIQTANSTSSPLPVSSDDTKDVLHEEKRETAEVFESVEKQNISSCGLSALHDYVSSENPFDCRNVDNHDFRTCDMCKDFFPKPKSGEKCNDDVFPDVVPCQMCCHLSEDNLTANYVKHCNVNSPLGHLNPCGLLSCPTDEAINACIFDYPNDKELRKISSTDVEGILDSDMLDFTSLKTIDQNHFNLKNSLDLLIPPSLRHNQKTYENFCNFPNEITVNENNDNLKESILNENDFLFISEPVKTSVDSSSTIEISDQAVNENTSNNENSPMEEDPDEKDMSIDEGSDDDEVLLNKVPTYLSGLSTEAINNKSKISYQSYIDNGIDTSDFIKDPSPEHVTELCKIPAYHQSFSNSTKYDINSSSLVRKYPWSERRKSAIRHHQQFDSDCETSKSCLSSSSSPSPSDSPTEEFPSWSQSSSRSTSPSSDSRSGQFSPYSDYTSSRDRSPSPFSQHRSTYSLQKVSRQNRNYSRIRSPYRYSNHHRSRRRSSLTNKYHDKDIHQDERRIVYVGKLPLNYTSNQLKELFSKWGPVEKVSLHFREHQDNYGFVTFYHQSDAYLSMDATSKIKDFPFDVCFGGRRTFCQESYADLDSLVEDEEEFGTVIQTSNVSFEQLLKDWKRDRKH